MKCVCCNSKKGKRICSANDNELICSNCCGLTRNIQRCSSFCEYMCNENSNHFPSSSIEITEVGRGKVILFSESLYLPNINECIFINIKDMIINIKTPILISVSLKFELKNRVKRVISMDELYFKDKWKRAVSKEMPFLQVYTIGRGKIYNVNLKTNNIENKVLIENNHLDTWLPNSSCNLEKITKEQIIENGLPKDTIAAFVSKGKSFWGNNSTFFSELNLDKTYSLEFDIIYDKIDFNERKIILPLGLFFPYSLVNFEKYKVNISRECCLNENAEIHLMLPYEKDDYKISPIPLENNNLLSSFQYCRHELINMQSNFYYDSYCIMNHMFNINLNLQCIAKAIFNEIPIFTGIYDSFNKVYNDKYSPLSVLILNNSDIIEKFKIEVEIFGLSYKYIKEVNVEPYKVKKVNISPRLIDEKIEAITANVEKEIYVKVSHGLEIIFEDSNTCLVYPKETFIEKLDNQRKDWKIDFGSFIARWITPNDPRIDSIIAKASINSDITGGLSNNFNKILYDIKKYMTY